MSHVAEFSIDSEMQKFSPVYRVVVYVYLKESCKLSRNEKWAAKSSTCQVLKVDVDIKDYFNAEGYLQEKTTAELADRFIKAMAKA